jgi:small subunit ribosomal protein S20
MANIKSAKKRAKQTIKKHSKNLARRSALKTSVKKVLAAVAVGEDIEKTKALLKEAESKLARAKGKKVLHKKTAQRKISRLAKRVASAERAQSK